MYFFRKTLVAIWLVLSCSVVYAQDSQTMSATVEFVVNTNKIVQNENYTRFLDVVVPTILEKSDNIENILLIGSASPEGRKDRNLYLAQIRASKIHSYFKGTVLDSKVRVVNDYSLFLEKTGLTEEDYEKLRATYIEIHFKKSELPPPIVQKDTVYLRDTIRYCRIDTVYVREKPRLIPILGIKTNLVSDLLATPNVQAELYTHLWGLSLEFDYTFPWWKIDDDKYLYYQILNGTVGLRKYLKNNYTGHYLGVYANTAIYDLCFLNKDKGWQGELYGAGLSYGYVFQSKKYPRLKFELHTRIGWFNTRFDTYHASQPFNEKYYYDWTLKASDFIPRRFNMNYFGPIELGFTLTFDLVCLRRY